MKLLRICCFTIVLLLISLFLTSPVYADWPMQAHDPQRTSFAPEDNIPSANKKTLACSLRCINSLQSPHHHSRKKQ